MSQSLIKLAAVLAGLGILAFFLRRNLKAWELEVIETQPSQPKVKPAPPAKKVEVKKTKVSKPKANTKDDLKQIKGIGPSIEQKLHKIGIHTFQQIAELTSQDIEKIDAQLSGFSGRIERDHWIDQAKALQK